MYDELDTDDDADGVMMAEAFAEDGFYDEGFGDEEADEFDAEDAFWKETLLGGGKGLITGGLGGATSGALSGYLSARRPNRSERQKKRDAATGAYLGSQVGSLAKLLLSLEDGESPEVAFNDEEVEQSEYLGEQALEAEDDAEVADAIDEMVFASLGGLARSSARVRRTVLPTLTRLARRYYAQARRDPRYRAVARLVPLAIRQTMMVVTREAMQGRRPTSRRAAMVFTRILSAMVRKRSARQSAVRLSRSRARRYRARYGAPSRPLPVRRYPARRRYAYRGAQDGHAPR